MTQDYDTLLERVRTSSDVVQASRQLIDGICQRLRDAGKDTDKLQNLVNDLTNGNVAFSEAVAHNTQYARPLNPAEPYPQPVMREATVTIPHPSGFQTAPTPATYVPPVTDERITRDTPYNE